MSHVSFAEPPAVAPLTTPTQLPMPQLLIGSPLEPRHDAVAAAGAHPATYRRGAASARAALSPRAATAAGYRGARAPAGAGEETGLQWAAKRMRRGAPAGVFGGAGEEAAGEGLMVESYRTALRPIQVRLGRSHISFCTCLYNAMCMMRRQTFNRCKFAIPT